LKNNKKIGEARLIGMINYEDETRVGMFSTDTFKITKQEGEFTIYVKFYNHNLTYGKYFLDFNIGSGNFTSTLTDYDVVYNTISFEVIYDSINNKRLINSWRDSWGRIYFKSVEVNIIS